LMAATLARGQTQIHNAACEPEIVDLAVALKSMGAIISGEGTSTITIEGVERLKGMNHSVTADRVEAGTYLCAAMMTGGEVTVDGIAPEPIQTELNALVEMGAKITSTKNSVTLSAPKDIKPIQLTTAPYPGFPTDMQAQFMAVMTQAQGESKISETIFENRFMHVPELARLGAKISIQGNTATIKGPVALSGAIVMATDLRASASLILAGLAAKGQTTIRRIYHLDRGYEHLEAKLSALGAVVERQKE
jgi:UDP-N-acetylglucosamine 1-carboxyvinyltransferase